MIDDEEIMDDEMFDDANANQKLNEIVSVCMDTQAFIALQARPVKNIALWFGDKLNITVVSYNGIQHRFGTSMNMGITDESVSAALQPAGITIYNCYLISPLGFYGWKITSTDLDKILRQAIRLSNAN